MDFFGLLRIMLRRWFVVIPVLVVAAFLGVNFIEEPDVSYSSGGSELLVVQDGESADEATPTGVAINTVDAGLLLREALSQQSYRASLDDQGLVSNFAIAEDLTPTILTIDISSTDAGNVLETGVTIVEDLDELLANAIGGDALGVRLRPITDLSDDDVVTSGDLSSLSVSVAILPSSGVSANPYPPNLPTVRLVTDLAQRPSVGEAVRAVAPSAGYIVSSQQRDTAAIVNIGITTPNRADIEPAYRAAVDAVNAELAGLQLEAGVQEGNLTVLSTLNPPGGGVQNSSSIVRPAAGVALLGVAAACVLAVLVDGLILRRRAKKRAKVDDREADESFVRDDRVDRSDTMDEWELQDALDR